jgi:DNA modification methylase
MTGRALVVRGDALQLPLPDGCADLIITSPPFFWLRAYNAGPGEIGSEPTPAAFLESLWAATREMVRVLKPSGSIFVNLGDKYNSAPGGPLGSSSQLRQELPSGGRTHHKPRRLGESPGRLDARAGFDSPARPQIREKSLLGLPWAYALGATGMLAALGGPNPALNLIHRATIVWQKPNGLPESVTDRVRVSHEYWFHLTKQPRYYAAVDEVREPHAAHTLRYYSQPVLDRLPSGTREQGREGWEGGSHPLGKLPGSVWSIPSEPLRLPDWLNVQHYAAFPSEWPRRLILGWSPPGICVECGQGRFPVVDVERTARRPSQHKPSPASPGDPAHGRGWLDFTPQATILGYACACTPYTDHPGTGEPSGEHGRIGNVADNGGYPENFGAGSGTHDNLSARPKVGPWREYHLDGWRPPPTRPALVVDPFGGTGTTAMVARALGRHAVTVDLSHAYSRAARWRVTSDNAAKAISKTNAERQGSLL